MSVDLAAVRRALVVGIGRSGQAATALLRQRGADVRVTDSRSEAELGDVVGQLPADVPRFLGGHPRACLDGAELVVTSPGVPARAAILEMARSRDLPVIAEVELAWMARPEPPLVAVTGSNGKSTVTVLIAEMLRAGGLEAIEGGNLGTAASELATRSGWSSWVLEISSFQAEILTAMRPQVGVLLNLSEDHLERHPDLASYLAAKQRLLAFQTESDSAVLDATNPDIWASPTRARRLGFAIENGPHARLDGGKLMLGDQQLLEADELALAGRHNVSNALAAALAASRPGVGVEAIASVLRSFTGLEHRHRLILEHAGVRWVDDSKATNVGATRAGLEGYPAGSVHLILGGLGKGQDFSLLREPVGKAAAAVYLIGRDGPAIGESLAGVAELTQSKTLEKAIHLARRAARPGQTVLLAPACASFDQFSSYSERGRVFARLARAAAGEEDKACR